MRFVLSVFATLAIFTLAYRLDVNAQTTGPEATVRAFYAYSNARSSIFNRRHVELRKRWYTAGLYRAFLAQVKEDEAYLKANPTDKPFFGDGLTFRPLDETCDANGRHYKRTYRVGRAIVTGSRANVDVRFAYPKACAEQFEPIVYRVNLRRVNGKWLIADWTYPDGSTLTSAIQGANY